MEKSHAARLVTLLLGTLLLTGLATGTAEARFRLGATVGLNFASLSDIEVAHSEATYDNRAGYHFGGYLQSALGPIGVRAGLLYVNAGPLFEGLSENASDVAGVPDDFDDGFDVTFITIPIDFQYRMVSPVIRPYLLVGPELRFHTSSSDDFKDNFKSATLMASVGAGIEWDVPFAGLTLAPELRYEFALNGLTDENLTIAGAVVETSEEQKVEAFVLRLHVGF